MEWISDFVKRLAALHYFVANTPMYLFQRLRSEPVIQESSASTPSEDLIRVHNDAVSQYPVDHDFALLAYAAIAALSLKPGLNTVSLRESLKQDRAVPWLDELQEILRSTYKDADRVVASLSQASARQAQVAVIPMSATTVGTWRVTRGT